MMLAHTLLCLSIIGMAIYRAAKMDKQTRLKASLALTGLFLGALYILLAPGMGMQLHPAVIGLEASIAWWMFVSNGQWKNGAPWELRHWRRSSDKS